MTLTMTIEQKSIDTALLGTYTDRRGGRAAQEIAQLKKADALNS
ncbi:hypothetical protein LAC30SC_07570 [Lactobacillus amylovorus]|uniref:Uncharacterized protein n=1 Tax=Lactobacillus amylovorus TaxID=1604 RepID=F0TFY2_LACAM|nr:hypothetical protein LAC30SC_07570 [Lactobacillus amylovorus]